MNYTQDAAIPQDVRADIVERLGKVEKEHDVKILFAIESGSRAWGFSSPNSDFDVRFIYMRDPGWYQAVDLEERRDVIEYQIVDDIDLNGWDVRKALRLFWKSNPAFVEWIQSPIIYSEVSDFRARAIRALPQIYAPEKGVYHYRSMAKANFRGYLKGPMVRLKKYFYVLRPLLAASWVERSRSAAPIEFDKLLTLVSDAQVLEAIHALLVQKRGIPELGMAPAVPVLNQFIEAELSQEVHEIPKKSRDPRVVDLLNEMFHGALREYESAPSSNRT